MAMKCELCGKGRMVGRQHTHHPGVAGGRWKKRAPKTQKVFLPNLHVARVVINGLPRLASGKAGVSKRMRLCTKCLRRVKEEMKVKVKVKEAGEVQPQQSATVTA